MRQSHDPAPRAARPSRSSRDEEQDRSLAPPLFHPTLLKRVFYLFIPPLSSSIFFFLLIREAFNKEPKFVNHFV